MIAGLVIALVAVEPDLGTTGVITLTAFTMFFVAGASLWQLALIIPAGIAALAVYPQHTTRRFASTRCSIPGRYAPERRLPDDPRAAGPGDGRHLSGSGLGQSRQPGGLLLPNAENDFIFAVVGQEFGLVGGVVVIGLYLFLAYRGVRSRWARRTPSGRCWRSGSRPGSRSRR